MDAKTVMELIASYKKQGYIEFLSPEMFDMFMKDLEAILEKKNKGASDA